MAQFPHRRGQPTTDLAQGMGCSQLAKQHRYKLIPAAKPLRSSLRLMLSYRSRKCPPIDQRKQLRKTTRYDYHRTHLRLASNAGVATPSGVILVLTTLLQVGVLFRCCLGQVWDRGGFAFEFGRYHRLDFLNELRIHDASSWSERSESATGANRIRLGAYPAHGNQIVGNKSFAPVDFKLFVEAFGSRAQALAGAMPLIGVSGRQVVEFQSALTSFDRILPENARVRISMGDETIRRRFRADHDQSVVDIGSAVHQWIGNTHAQRDETAADFRCADDFFVERVRRHGIFPLTAKMAAMEPPRRETLARFQMVMNRIEAKPFGAAVVCHDRFCCARLVDELEN